MRKLALLLSLLPCLASFGQGYKVYKSDGKVDAYSGETAVAVSLNDDSLRYDGHEYVDLGLPSGTRWATMNVGAEKDNPNGLHFTFAHAKTDVQWGGDWRMPGILEFQELLRVCKWEWTREGISQGYMVTGPNKNKLFLPAAGYIKPDGSFAGGLTCMMAGYWTSDGYSLVFSPEVKSLAANSQALQLSVRPVIGGAALQDVRSEVMTEGSHDYVDLGLSVLWATTNIGAATPEEYGDYFGSCMTDPMPANYMSLSYEEQNNWYQSHSPFYVNSMPIPGYMYHFYVEAGGHEDELQAYEQQYYLNDRKRLGEMGYWILPEHDAATVLWGDGWRMPTLSEYKELIEKTTRRSSGSIFVFSGSNGNTVTIPRAGCYSTYDGRFNNSYGYYLTSSIVNYPYLVDITQRTFQYNEYYAREYFCPIRPVKDRPKAGLTDEKTTAQQEMVDLGLSVLWANCNLGAATPQDKGEYVAWGETFPKATYTKTNYKKAAYSAQNTQNMFSNPNWTIPSSADVQELIEKCTWVREADGYRVTGPNGNSIFLPYTGFRDGSVLSYPDELGFYWMADTTQALRIDNAGAPACKEATGYFGMAIRPVMPLACPETGEAQTDWHSATITCKARSSYSEFGIQLCYIEFMDNPASEAWKVPADLASLQEGKYTLQVLLQPNMPYYYRAYAVTNDSIPQTLYGTTKRLHTTADIPAVDLGLSVKWAPVNLGATNEYDIMDWYIHPSYSYNNAKQLPPISYGTFKDFYLTPQTSWPEEWRMPTEEEFQELLSKCTWEWQEGGCDDLTTIVVNAKNRNGYKITGPNGNSIFLPANGIGDRATIPIGIGFSGYYWTQTPSEKHAGCYDLLKFTATDKKFSFGPATSQYIIRPVKK